MAKPNGVAPEPSTGMEIHIYQRVPITKEFTLVPDHAGASQEEKQGPICLAWTQKEQLMFCDAAYAPKGDRSHGGRVVTYVQRTTR